MQHGAIWNFEHMIPSLRPILLALLAVASAAMPLYAQESKVPVEVLDTGKAEPGKEWTLKLRFAVPEGYHAYHKDNPGFSQPIKVEFKELSGLKEVKQVWPEPKKHKEEHGEEWELAGNVDIGWVFTVPASAKDKLDVRGEYEVQFCDANGCMIAEGKFATTVTVAAAKSEPEGPSITASAAFEGEVKAGGQAVLAVAFEVSKGFSAYHKDSPGLSKPMAVKFSELGSLKLESEVWPEPKKVKEEWADKEDWKLSGKFTIKYTFAVPADAKGEIGVVGTFEAQICDPDMCHDRSGTFAAAAVLALPTDKNKDALPDSAEPQLLADDAKPADWPEGLFGPPAKPAQTAMVFESGFAPGKANPGQEVTLELRFKLGMNKAGEYYHAYHPGTKATAVNIPISVEWVSDGGLTRQGDLVFPEPAEKIDEGSGEEWRLPHDFTLQQKFRVPDGLKAGAYRVYGHIIGQYCDSDGCIFFNAKVAASPNRKFGWVATLNVEGDGNLVPKIEPPKNQPDPGPKPEVGTTKVEPAGTSPTVTADKDGLIWFLLVAFGAGIITLLTPCVLPVLPLTIGFFVGQANKGKSPFLTAFIYCTCIVASFTAFGLITSIALGATGAQNIATNGYVNSFLAVLFLVFALSFLGLFELRVPTFITAWFSRKQMNAQQEGHGYAKALFSGSAFSLISFSCTGPIAGGFLAQAATGSVWTPTLAMMAFSSGMALPIFVMGQFPSLMKRMPKSGGWMNAMKVVFGFVEIGLAIMYLSAAEQAFRGITAAEWVSRFVVLAVWASVSIAAALYLFGIFRMPHDHEETKQIGVLRGLFAVMFLAFGLYMVPGLFGAKYGSHLEGILPPPPSSGGIQLSTGGKKGNDYKDLPWEHDFDKALAASAIAKKPLFVDFTGFN